MRVTTGRAGALGADVSVRSVIGVGAGAARGGGAAADSTRARAAKLAARAGAFAWEEAHAQGERAFLWSPVAMGSGAALYLVLPREPTVWLAAGALALALGGAVGARRWGRSAGLAALALLLAFGAAGFAAGAFKTRWIAAPVAPASRRAVRVQGWVVDVVSADAAHERVLVAPVRLGRLAPEATPALIRLSLRGGAPPAPGSAVQALAIVGPPPPPAAPGAYDFARDAWFSGIGGSGLSLRATEPTALPTPPLGLRAELALNAARWGLASKLVARMGPRRGGLAAALVTGHQAWLDPGDVQAMRDSGLAHILSISGVHMAIVGGFVFALTRLGVAAWPWLALRVSGKKIAAWVGLAAVSGYLVLSGAPPPAVRSALTAGIAFVAVLNDRRALTLHSLALAALAILSVQPEAVAQPGFQMSFAATAALLALAEAWPHASREINTPLAVRLAQRARDWLVAGAAVSLVAGLATDPFAIQHFNRITTWGLPANLATELLSSFVIMPALAVGAMVELAGWGGPPLAVAGWGLDGLTAVARLFAGLPHAVVGWPSAPAAALPVSFLGLLVICLWRGRLRWLGAPLFLAVWLWPRPAPPAVWIAPEGANAAVVVREGGRGTAVLARPRSQRFAFELWAKRRGYAFADPRRDEGAAAAKAADALFACKRYACTPTARTSGAGAPVRLAGWWSLRPPGDAAVNALCAGAELVVLRTGAAPPPARAPACRGVLVLDQTDFASGGSMELWRGSHRPGGDGAGGNSAGGGWRQRWAQDLRGDRPWTAPAPAPGAGADQW